jgi:ubiquinone/menaquinone biosynthesis C-methylase UbiE
MQDYGEGLKKIAAFVQQDDYQKKYMVNACDRSDLNNDEIERANQQTYEMLADKAHIAEASTILDWPTGKGCFLRTMLDKVQQDSMIICLDIDFIELASLKAYLQNQQKADNVYFVNADVRQMPLPSEVFDAVTAWGGFIEVPEAPKAISESYRVLKQGGCFAGDGEVYEENSESIKIAERIGVGYLISQDRIEDCIADSGFRDIYTESVFEDYDRTEPGPDRCPLPAYGDWFGIVVASGRK